MCGIIASFNRKDNANEWVTNQYEDQYSRGTEGFGLCLIDDTSQCRVLRACEPTKMMLDLYMNKAKSILLHHRTPTSTENWLNQTHPIKVSHGSLKYDYLVIHNGVISNATKLKDKHEALGFVYTTAYESSFNKLVKFNDSEALAHEVARFIEKQITELDVRGSAAFIALRISKDAKSPGKLERVYFGRNEGSPLNLLATKNKIHLSSEGEGETVKPFTLMSFTPSDYKIKERKMTFTLPAVVPLVSNWKGWDDWDYNGKRDIGFSNTPKQDKFAVPKVDKAEAKSTDARQMVIDDCEKSVLQALEIFTAELKEDYDSAFCPEAGECVKEIADAIYRAQRDVEDLNQSAAFDTKDAAYLE